MNSSSGPTAVIGLIPARWASSRFPGKPLHPLHGKPLIQHVFERASQCKGLADLAIATDDSRISEVAKGFGAKVILTSSEHPTGTDRLAEAARDFPEASHFINIQGDEPLIEPTLIDQLAQVLAADADLEMVTAASLIKEENQIADPNIVKVVVAQSGNALYFSRSPIPFVREPGRAPHHRHIGIYGYRADFLQTFIKLPPSPLEESESLEQLRALDNGARIHVVMTDHEAIGLDTPEQVSLLERLLKPDSDQQTP